MAIDLNELIAAKDLPPRIVLLGGRGVGKTTVAIHAPKPFFLNLENSRVSVNLGKGNQKGITTYEEVLDFIDSLHEQEHKYYSLVIDSLDVLETIITEYVCRVNSYTNINQTKWGIGLSQRHDVWMDLLTKLDELNADKGMIIILVAHTVIEKVEEPMLPAYDRHTIKLYKRDGPCILDWVDLIGFCNIKTYTTKDGERNMASTAGIREICCQPNPSYEAKTRYLGMPDEIPMDWDVLCDYMKRGSREPLAEPKQHGDD